ncbi:hypothetical protein KJ570_03990 [Patescibacteria group bacterium]|nr:hypothetical protein [Patescibacteria group bacterium]MBU2035853.1 hypothetical protein [Patescibacteria group bacterium]
MNIKIKYFLKLFIFSLLILNSANKVSAQELNISVTPPITEILMVPGKQIVQSYKITNDSSSKLISVNIVPFLPDIKNPEEIVLNLQQGLVESNVYESWFSIEKPKINFGEKFNLPANSEEEIRIKISVPKNATLKDYYFTVLFSIEKPNTQITESSLQSMAQIGSNILITASENENPYKAAKTVLFSSPYIIDSLQKINFKIIIENTGRAFGKPIGKITIENLITKKTESLNLSPLNILSSYSREIYCLKEEKIIPCETSPKLLLGLYKSTLNYNLDGEGQSYQEESYTFAVPFSLIIAILVVLIIYKIIVSKTKK